MAINVIIKDPQWKEIWNFIAEDWKNIVELAEMHWIKIPEACGGGVCGVCLCKVEEWNNVVKSDAFNSPIMPLESDENWNPKEILACVAWFNSESFNDWKDHIVVLQKSI